MIRAAQKSICRFLPDCNRSWVPGQAAGGERGDVIPGRCGAGRKVEKWSRNCPELECRAGNGAVNDVWSEGKIKPQANRQLKLNVHL